MQHATNAAQMQPAGAQLRAQQHAQQAGWHCKGSTAFAVRQVPRHARVQHMHSRHMRTAAVMDDLEWDLEEGGPSEAEKADMDSEALEFLEEWEAETFDATEEAVVGDADKEGRSKPPTEKRRRRADRRAGRPGQDGPPLHCLPKVITLFSPSDLALQTGCWNRLKALLPFLAGGVPSATGHALQSWCMGSSSAE